MKTTMKTIDHAFKLVIAPFFLTAIFSLMGCDPGQPEGSSGFNATGFAAPLSQAEFNTLTPEEQYQVASKIYGTLYRGISAEDFFDLEAGTGSLKPKSNTFLTDTKKALTTSLSADALNTANALIEGFDEEGNPKYPNIKADEVAPIVEKEDFTDWDNGYPSGGNYWSDYLEKYPLAEEIESSGIWNEPYQIFESENDNFPLINQ